MNQGCDYKKCDVKSITPCVAGEIIKIIKDKVTEVFPDDNENLGINVKITKLELSSSIEACANEQNKALISTNGNIATVKGVYCEQGLACEFNAIADVQFNGEYTLAIVKPDAYQHTPSILEMIQRAGLRIAKHNGSELKLERQLTINETEEFYKIHCERPFYKQLCEFIASDKVVIMVLCGVNAVKGFRDLMGTTNPEAASPGTIRKEYGTDIDKNAIHGSDSIENAELEINQFFPELKYPKIGKRSSEE